MASGVKIPFQLVDVFTDRPLSGNQLCVVPAPVDVSAELMQAIAKEIGFSETTFVTSAAGDQYSMRIFTPERELPFAGHPSLGTAYVLVAEDRISTPATQHVEAGEFAMQVDLSASRSRMRQRNAQFTEPVDEPTREALVAAVGLGLDDLLDLPAQKVATGFGHLMLPVRDPARVASALPNHPALIPLLEGAGTDGVYVFAMTGSSEAGPTAKARLFAPVAGVDEDPATGSAAGPLGAYAVQHELMSSGRLTISQGAELGRPSTLIVDVEPDGDELAVYVEGGVQVIATGEFEVSGYPARPPFSSTPAAPAGGSAAPASGPSRGRPDVRPTTGPSGS
jgi:PhzF family phenazine biosynthesis protein